MKAQDSRSFRVVFGNQERDRGGCEGRRRLIEGGSRVLPVRTRARVSRDNYVIQLFANADGKRADEESGKAQMYANVNQR